MTVLRSIKNTPTQLVLKVLEKALAFIRAWWLGNVCGSCGRVSETRQICEDKMCLSPQWSVLYLVHDANCEVRLLRACRFEENVLISVVNHKRLWLYDCNVRYLMGNCSSHFSPVCFTSANDRLPQGQSGHTSRALQPMGALRFFLFFFFVKGFKKKILERMWFLTNLLSLCNCLNVL